MTNQEIIKKLEYIHFALQEAQNMLGDDPEIENAIYVLEDIREYFWVDNE